MYILSLGNDNDDCLALNEPRLFGQLYPTLVHRPRKRFHQIILLVTIVPVEFNAFYQDWLNGQATADGVVAEV